MLRSAQKFVNVPPSLQGQSPPSSIGFDLLMTALPLWMMIGLYMDGWAHNHLDSTLETFFTPWHAVLYSGFAVCSMTLVAVAAMNRRKGFAWRRLLPAGYGAMLVGAGIFAAGGVFDMLWHTVFGVENNLEALLSPPHLILFGGGVLIAGGPLRAAWKRAHPPRGFTGWLPVILSMTLVFSLTTFITQFAHFVVDVPAGGQPSDVLLAAVLQSQNVAGYIFQSMLLLGAMLIVLQRWGEHLPIGTFTMFFGINIFGMTFMTDEYRLMAAALAAGLTADILAKKLRPSVSNVRGLRLFCVAVPAVTMLSMFTSWILTDRVWWSVHMWTGTIMITGFAGLLLSYLVVPPGRASLRSGPRD